jgi:2-keto-4-pentenoate hydratase/2-oxohepta-3-ene-1,7-dioic acid hydratase in catechol pathway
MKLSPTKIICVGRNYAEHAKELGNEVPQSPLLFFKPLSSLIGNEEDIHYPKLSQRVDFEGELGVIIGKRTHKVSVAEAMDSVGAFTIVNDVTARDIQKQDGNFFRGKCFDTFCAVGPTVAAAGFSWQDAAIETKVNGELKQHGSTASMIFDIPFLISYISQVMTLQPGDLIATGTPPGVGPLAIGDVVEVTISGIGTLRNRVVAEPE